MSTTNAKTFDPDARYIVGRKASNPMPGREVTGSQIFTGREMRRDPHRISTTDQFWRKNPLGMKPDVHMAIYVVDPKTGMRTYFDEGRFMLMRPNMGLSDGPGRIDRALPAPGEDTMRPSPFGASASPFGARPFAGGPQGLAPSLPDALASGQTAQLIDVLKAELAVRNDEIRVTREELRNIYQELSIAQAARVTAEAELAKQREINAHRERVEREVENKLKAEFEADVHAEARKIAKRQGGDGGGLGDSMGSLLQNPLVQSAIGVLISKFAGGAAAPPTVTTNPATAERAYTVNAPAPVVGAAPADAAQPAQPAQGAGLYQVGGKR